jgi:hypothetical protein
MGLIRPAVTICKCRGDNVLEIYDWTDAESKSNWLTRSLSQSPNAKSRSKVMTDTKSRSKVTTDTKSTSKVTTDTKSRSNVTTDTMSRSFMLRGNWGLIWWRPTGGQE